MAKKVDSQAPGKATKDEFVKGDKGRRGADIKDTEFDKAVDKEAVDAEVTTEAKWAGLFDEGAMDPYEAKHARD